MMLRVNSATAARVSTCREGSVLGPWGSSLGPDRARNFAEVVSLAVVRGKATPFCNVMRAPCPCLPDTLGITTSSE